MQQLPVIILCGGLGLRLRTTPDAPPKALTPIGGMPVLWHVMNIYARYGARDFILALGHRGDDIVAWFEALLRGGRDMTIDFAHPDRRVLYAGQWGEGVSPSPKRDDKGSGGGRVDVDVHRPFEYPVTDWRVTFVETGEETMTGGRLRRVLPHLATDRAHVTYADGLTDAAIPDIVARHDAFGVLATVLAVHPQTNFGIIEHADGIARTFIEKPQRSCCINGGFLVVERDVLERCTDDACVFEEDVLPALAREGRLGVHEHTGFWHCLDTQKDAADLNALWHTGNVPWYRSE
jgi:glucose-1-phosphate cytidylyltransferase